MEDSFLFFEKKNNIDKDENMTKVAKYANPYLYKGNFKNQINIPKVDKNNINKSLNLFLWSLNIVIFFCFFSPLTNLLY